jgi:CRP-like cAMP-binding protein
MVITRDEALTDAVRRGAGGDPPAAATPSPAPSRAAQVFHHLAGAELPEWPALAPHVRRRELAAGEALFRAGEARPFVYVLSRGVVKMVYETEAGEAWVKGFAEPGLCFASVTALAPGGLTSFAAYAEVDCVVEQVEYARLLALAERHLPWQKALSEAFKRYGQRKEQRERELLTLSPEARYLGFLREHPALAAVLRQRDIASYVRITPVALSRIKARLKTRGAAP